MAPPTRTACIVCDLIVTLDPLESGQSAGCPRCGHLLTVCTKEGVTKSLALALASAMLLVAANLFPFLSLQASGLEQTMTLPGSALQLYGDGYLSVAVLVGGPIVAIPALMLATVLMLLVPLHRGRAAPWLVPAGRMLFWLSPWSMVEVFVIGVLVSLVKIGAMATVVLGISFWAYIAFAICFTAMLTNLDRVQIWHDIEACTA